MQEIRALLSKEATALTPMQEGILARYIWDRYHMAKQAGTWKISFWVVKKDFSATVAGWLVKLFGIDPLNRPV